MWGEWIAAKKEPEKYLLKIVLKVDES